MSYDPRHRYYASCVTGYSASSGGGNREKTLWYVLDSVPPRTSWFMGWGEIGEQTARDTVGIWNRDEQAWWDELTRSRAGDSRQVGYQPEPTPQSGQDVETNGARPST